MKKSDLAKSQIEKAIDLFLEGEYAPSITLAGAAEEMLGNILHQKGKDNILAQLHPWFNDHYGTNLKFSELAKGANEIRDELKHGHLNPSIDYEIEITLAYCTQMLLRALHNYSLAVGTSSEKMKWCATYISVNYDLLFSEWSKT